jgi:arylsulfatase
MGLRRWVHPAVLTLAALALLLGAIGPATAQPQNPNILFIVSDDTGYGDLGPYGGGEGRGMPTPSIDRMAAEGMTFFSFYAQPSCTPGRAAMQTGRIPNRSGMTTVAFQGQGGGLPAAEWTLASVLKQGGYQTYFTGKWHLGEADYALPNAHSYDEMKYVGLYHLNAYTYGDPTWFPDMDPELRAMFQKVTIGSLSGKAGEKAKEDFKIKGQHGDEPGKRVTLHGVEYPNGVVGIPYFDIYVEKAALEFLEKAAKDPSKPFFINVNFMKVHQPNLPAPEFEHKSLSKSKYADSVVELDARIGRIMDKLRQLGLDRNTLVFYTTDNGQPTGALAVDTNLGWKGAEQYVTTVPQVFDLWQDPQERYDLFMNTFTERTWTLVTISQAIKELMGTYVKYPPRKLQSMSSDGPIEISKYERFQWIREMLQKEGVNIPLPTGN